MNKLYFTFTYFLPALVTLLDDYDVDDDDAKDD